MSIFIESVDDNCKRVLFYKEFFEKDAVFNAAYKMQEHFHIKIEPYQDKQVAVIMLKKDNQTILEIENALKEFCNEVIDQQIRLDLEQRTKAIRDVIYNKAFQAINNQKAQDSQ